jgi:hypothetical protein
MHFFSLCEPGYKVQRLSSHYNNRNHVVRLLVARILNNSNSTIPLVLSEGLELYMRKLAGPLSKFGYLLFTWSWLLKVWVFVISSSSITHYLIHTILLSKEVGNEQGLTNISILCNKLITAVITLISSHRPSYPPLLLRRPRWESQL